VIVHPGWLFLVGNYRALAVYAEKDLPGWLYLIAGNKVEAYGGTISFTLGHSEYNSLGLGAQEDYDLILESKTEGITLGHKHIVPGQLPLMLPHNLT
jgi:hypothetical protein